MRHRVRVSDSAETFKIIIDSKGQFDKRIQYSPEDVQRDRNCAEPFQRHACSSPHRSPDLRKKRDQHVPCRMSCNLSTGCSTDLETSKTTSNHLDTLSKIEIDVQPHTRIFRESLSDRWQPRHCCPGSVPTRIITFENTSSRTDVFAPVHSEIEMTSISITAAAQFI